jgi:hypothetical protein
MKTRYCRLVLDAHADHGSSSTAMSTLDEIYTALVQLRDEEVPR